MTRESFRKKLVSATGGCSAQHDGWPCNTCFHVLKLKSKIPIHDFWEAVLAYRGDYPSLKKRPDLIQELNGLL
jgi:hypothetical protein